MSNNSLYDCQFSSEFGSIFNSVIGEGGKCSSLDNSPYDGECNSKYCSM